MATYSDLALNRFFLVIENEGEDISLVQPLMESSECILLQYHDISEATAWKKKSESLYELVDELDDEQLAAYEDLFGEDVTEWDEE